MLRLIDSIASALEANEDAELAKAIYIGIIHDTGVFQYSNTLPETMEKAAKLIGYGFDFPRLIQETFYQKTYKQTQITGRALVESMRFLEGKCIVSCVTRTMMDFYGAEPADLDGIVNHLRNIKDTFPCEYPAFCHLVVRRIFHMSSDESGI
mgnify:CR=1 FL=1